MKYIFIYPLISAILAALYGIGFESFIRYFENNSLAISAIINISGGIFLLLLVPNKKENIKKIPAKDLLMMFAASFFAFGPSYLLYYKAMDLIGSSKVSFLAQSETAFVVVLSILFLKEKFKPREFFGFFVVLSGILLLNFDASLFSFSFGIGEICALFTYLALAIGVVIISKLVKKYDLIYLTGLEMIFGGIISCLFLIANPVSIRLPLPLILLLFPLGFTVALAWLAYILGLKNIGTSKTAIIYSSQSFFTLMFSYYAMKILPSLGLKIPTDLPTFLAAGVIMFAGIVILETGKEKPA